LGLSNCTKCGQVMVNEHSSFCKSCLLEQKVDIELVKAYLRTHSNPTMLDVYNKTGVPLSTIEKFIKDGIISRIY
jgi:hypothetical protein